MISGHGEIKDIDTDIKWVNKQNREYPFCKYWIELLPENEGEDSFPINIECIDGLLKIKRKIPKIQMCSRLFIGKLLI